MGIFEVLILSVVIVIGKLNLYVPVFNGINKYFSYLQKVSIVGEDGLNFL